MKQFLLFISLFMSTPAFAGVEETVDFNFQTLSSWQEMTTFSNEDLYLLKSTTEYSGNVVNISNHTLTVNPINVTFSTGSSYGGGMIYKIINGNSLHYGLTLYKDARMTVEIGGNCKLKSIQFLDYSTGGDISTIDQPGEYSSVHLKWAAGNADVSSIRFTNGGSDALIYRMRVVYERPSIPLSFSYSNPSEGSQVNSFNSMQVYFDRTITKVNSSIGSPTISGPGIDGVKTMTVTHSGSAVTLSVSPQITKDGQYTVSIPAGLFENAESGVNEAMTINFDVYATRNTLNQWTVDPAQGTYTSLPQDIMLTFADDVLVDDTKSGILSLTKIDNSVSEYPVTFSVDDTKRIVTLKNSHGIITEEGTCTITIPEAAIHNSFFKVNEEKDRWNPEFTLTYIIERQERTEIKNARKLLALNGIGYPSANSTARTNLNSLVEAYDANPDSWTEDNTSALTAAITAFYDDVDVTLPSDGHWYKITGVNAAPQETCKKAYLFYSDEKVTLSSFDANMNGSKFKAIVSDGKISFVTADGEKALCVLSDKDYSGANINNVRPISHIATKLTLSKLAVEGADKDLQLGKLSITGRLGYDENEQDCGSSIAAINYDGNTIVATPTNTSYFGTSVSSAFIFEETSEPVDVENYIEPEAELDHPELDNNNVGLRLSIHYVKSATIKDKTKIKFYKDGEEVNSTGDILTPVDGVPTDFVVNISKLTEAGYYDLSMKAGAFTFTPKDTDAANNKQVKDIDLVVSFRIKSAGTNPDPDPNPDPNPDPDPTPGPTPSTNFNVAYTDYVALQVALRSEQHVTWLYDSDLNDLIICSGSYSDLVPDPTKEVKIVQIYNNNTTGRVVGSGHFEVYKNFANDYPDYAYYKAIKLVMDDPIATGALEYSSGIYGYEIPEAAFGDANFGKYLAGDTSIQPSDCIVNPSTDNPKFSVNNEKARASVTDNNKSFFDSYKIEKKNEATNKAQEGDSQECEALITAAKAAIDALSYDTTKSLDANKELVDAIIAKLDADLAAQREIDNAITASKAALNKVIADATAYVESIKGEHKAFADVLDLAITAAKAKLNDVTATKSDLDDAKQTLESAVATIKQAIATGIEEMEVSGGVEGAAYYTLDGCKLDGKPTKKGVYIVNGRKVVIK